MNWRLVGTKGENTAAVFLKKKGYKLLASSFSSRWGEIDLIMSKGDVVAFIEVKLRKNADVGFAFEAVTRSKQEKIKKTALFWLMQTSCALQPRFDIIEVYTESGVVNHIENAFS